MYLPSVEEMTNLLPSSSIVTPFAIYDPLEWWKDKWGDDKIQDQEISYIENALLFTPLSKFFSTLNSAVFWNLTS